jgi:uncharacterized protein (UPF0335 family)
MTNLSELIAKKESLEAEIAKAMKEERDAVLKDIREKIKLFGFKTNDFKGVLKTRKRRSKADDTTEGE